MNFEWLVALRYLRSANRPAVLRLVTWLAVLGVVAGVMTLVIALAMNTGFRQVFRDRLLSVTAHVNLKPLGPEGIANYRELMDRIAKTPDVATVEPAVYETVLLSAGTEATGIELKGVDPALEMRATAALHRITAGTADFSPDANGIPALVVGSVLAGDMHIAPGDYVTLTRPEGSLTPFGIVPRWRRFRVTGVFASGFYQYDQSWAFTTLRAAQSLAGIGDVVSLLEIRVKNLDEAGAVASRVLASAGKGFAATTWMEENRALFRAMSVEKLAMALFLGLITFVAGLNILVVLTMTVTDRARDIAVLMAMGARRRQIRKVFVLQGVIVSAAGTAAGLAAGYAAAFAANRWRLVSINPEVYGISFVPFHAKGTDALWIAAAALVISVCATLLPARAAARIPPVDILRFE